MTETYFDIEARRPNGNTTFFAYFDNEGLTTEEVAAKVTEEHDVTIVNIANEPTCFCDVCCSQE